MTTGVDPRPLLHELGYLRVSKTRIARAVGCHTQAVQGWLFGLPIDATRRLDWVQRLIQFGLEVGGEAISNNERFGRTCGFAAERAVWAAIVLLIAVARQVVEDAEHSA